MAERGRPKGYVVTHRLSATMRASGALDTKPYRRCTCGRSWHEDTPEEAARAFAAHLDAMEDQGRPVER